MTTPTDIETCETDIGTLTLRHQPLVLDPARHVVEIRHNGQLLMSGGTNVSEIALATECLTELDGTPGHHILVGGLGLGYTAHAALASANVSSVTVIEFLPAILDWHRRGLFPLGETLLEDPRCQIVEGDFFSLVGTGGHRRIPSDSGSKKPFTMGVYDAILLDIDDAPGQHLHPAHRDFYRPEGLRQLLPHLAPGGVFGLWSCDPENGEPYEHTLAEVFKDVRVHPVPHHDETFNGPDNHLIYISKSPR